MINYLIAVGIIFGVLAAWIAVQQFARLFAARHPEFGPAKEEGMGCGMFCNCSKKEECPHREPRENHTAI